VLVADYRTPLPRAFAGLLEGAINRVLALDPDSAKRVLGLQGKCLQLDIEGLEIILFLTFESGNVRVGLDHDGEPDTVIRGSPFALFGMAAPGDASQWGLPGTDVNIAGNANLARDLERLFSQLDPDWQKPFTELFGDTLGYQLATGIEQALRALRDAAGQTAGMAASYLRDETGELLRPAEMKEFSRAVDALRYATDRLQARLDAMAAEARR
jgi:ubiquinone biosynthesis protein UbiJ